MVMTTNSIVPNDSAVKLLLEKFPVVQYLSQRGRTPLVAVPVEQLLEVCKFIQSDMDDGGLGYDYLSSVTATDYWEHFEVAYLVQSMHTRRTIELKVRVPREHPVAPSVVSIWKGANLQEREVYDLMGVEFSGHPDLSRVLLWDGFPGHPLRKDFDKLPDDIPIPQEEDSSC